MNSTSLTQKGGASRAPFLAVSVTLVCLGARAGVLAEGHEDEALLHGFEPCSEATRPSSPASVV